MMIMVRENDTMKVMGTMTREAKEGTKARPCYQCINRASRKNTKRFVGGYLAVFTIHLNLTHSHSTPVACRLKPRAQRFVGGYTTSPSSSSTFSNPSPPYFLLEGKKGIGSWRESRLSFALHSASTQHRALLRPWPVRLPPPFRPLDRGDDRELGQAPGRHILRPRRCTAPTMFAPVNQPARPS
jgi:hypothetical protein